MAIAKENIASDLEAARRARLDLAAAYRLAARYNFHEGIDNHFSLLLPDRDDLMLLNPYPLHWSEVTASNLLLVDLGGRKIQGEHDIEPSAYHIHAAVHRTDPRSFRCVLHTHMPYATAIACRKGGRLEMVHQNSLKFRGRVAYLDDYNGLALDQEEGARIARAMGGHSVLFLANHGVITAGRSVAEAFDLLYFLERACQVQILSESGGHERRLIPGPAAEHLKAQKDKDDGIQKAELHFSALKRILDREEPDYAS